MGGFELDAPRHDTTLPILFGLFCNLFHVGGKTPGFVVRQGPPVWLPLGNSSEVTEYQEPQKTKTLTTPIFSSLGTPQP